MIERILRRSGARVGLYTSPHIDTELERIQVDGRPITAGQALEHFNAMLPYLVAAKDNAEAYRPTFFEIFTAMAFLHFRHQQVDWAVVEVGLGGRLDATNVVSPTVCAITAIDFDHTERLGDTLALIAGEKAGIIKSGVPVVVSPQQPEALQMITEKAVQMGAPMRSIASDVTAMAREDGSFDIVTWRRAYRQLHCPMPGQHQRTNAATAVAVIETLNDLSVACIDEQAVRDGLAEARLPARIEVLSRKPWVVVDVAHNISSVKALLAVIAAEMPHRRMHLIFGCAFDKDASGIFELFAPHANRVIVTAINNPRTRTPGELAQLARDAGCAQVVEAESIDAAVAAALAEAQPDDLICIAGSFYLAGDARKAWSRLTQTASA